MSFLGIPQFTLDLIAFVILLFCLGLGASDRREGRPEQPNKPKKKQVINIIDSVVQRTSFNNETEENNEAVSALMALGYRKRQAKDAVGNVLLHYKGLTTEEAVKAALQKV